MADQRDVKSIKAGPPAAVVGGLALAVALDTFIQVTWKLAASVPPASSPAPAALAAVVQSRWFLAAMLAFAAQLWNWTRVLARADLSYAQPITALSYITVLGASAFLLHERVSARQGAGVGLILLGVWFISRTPSSTRGGAPAGP